MATGTARGYRSEEAAGDGAGASARGGLKRVLGLPFGVAAVIGGSIGSGILRSPGPVAAALPDARWIVAVWLAGGLLALVMALPLIDLASAMPKAGGILIYVERAFGPGPGIAVGWASWLQCVVALAFMAVAAGEYARRLGVPVPVGVLATMLIVVLTGLNLVGTRAGGRHQTIGQAAKLIGLIGLVALVFAAPAAPPVAGTARGAVTLGGLVIAAMLVNNSYHGWDAIVVFGEEMRRPARIVARATLIGIAIITATYVAMNLALLHALPLAAIARSSLPAADATRLVAGPAADRIVTALSLVSVVAIANLTTMLPARVLLALARWGAVPAVFGRVNAGGSPWAATVAGGVAAAALAWSGGYVGLNALYAPLAGFMAMVALFAAWRLRDDRALPRPWRLPLLPAAIVVALAVNAAMLVAIVAVSPWAAAGALALVVIGVLPLRRRAGGTPRRASRAGR